MTKVLANALVPIFAGLLLGYFAGLWRRMDNQNVRTLITFVMSFAIPCSLCLLVFQTLQRWAYHCSLRFSVREPRSRWPHLSQSAPSRFLRLPWQFLNEVAGPLLGSPELGPRERARRCGKSHCRLSIPARGLLFGRHCWGWRFSCADLTLPSFIHRSLAVMGSAADGSALVLTGLVVSAQKFEIRGNTLITVLLKNALQPAIALGICMLIHLNIEQTRYVTLISAMPCGFFGVVFGRAFDSNPKLASSGLIASYLVGVGSLAAWIVIVNHIG